MDGPLNISRYIALRTVEPQDKGTIRAWLGCAKTYLPSGVVATVQTTDEHGTLRSVSLVHREHKGSHEYMIPLTRDLIDREAEPMVKHFAGAHPEHDFEVEVSSSEAALVGKGQSIEVADNKYTDLCIAWAKKQHEDWMRDRVDAGWRYGPTISLSNKTHPLIRQWHELPDQFKKIDIEQPQSLLDLLNDQGYAVIARTELDGMLKLLKGGL